MITRNEQLCEMCKNAPRDRDKSELFQKVPTMLTILILRNIQVKTLSIILETDLL